MTIVFFGTEQFAARILDTLLASDITVAAVVTQPPRPVGRKQVITPSPVHERALASNLPVLTPTTLKDDAVHAALRETHADLFLVVQYGKIIPQAVLDIPHLGCVNIHASLLPRHRGASPVHATILAGDTMSGVTFMMMDAQMDHGPILATFTHPVAPRATTETLMSELAAVAAAQVVETLHAVARGALEPKAQHHDAATLTGLLSRESGYIHWDTQDAAHIERMIRAFTPWPGVTTWCDGTALKLVAAHVLDKQSPDAPGTIRFKNKQLQIATIRGTLVVEQLQPAGKSIMDAPAVKNGYPSLDGARCANPPADASQQ